MRYLGLFEAHSALSVLTNLAEPRTLAKQACFAALSSQARPASQMLRSSSSFCCAKAGCSGLTAPALCSQTLRGCVFCCVRLASETSLANPAERVKHSASRFPMLRLAGQGLITYPRFARLLRSLRGKLSLLRQAEKPFTRP